MLPEHGAVIEQLKQAGADPGELWLVEVQTLEEFTKFYPDSSLTFEILTTAEETGHDCIIYHHESGTVDYFGTYSQGDDVKRQEVVQWLARMLAKGEVKP